MQLHSATAISAINSFKRLGKLLLWWAVRYQRWFETLLQSERLISI